MPLDPARVSAGFPSPAADYEAESLDVGSYLIRNPATTFFFRVEGDSMHGVGICDGDILVVDKSISPQHGHIVVAFVDGERLVKRLYHRQGRLALEAENPRYPPLEIRESHDLLLWGVVVGRFKRFVP